MPPKKKKKRRKAGKGSAFEREVSKQLSEWWTGEEDSSVFWRSQTSGGRATQREKQGKKTHNQYGDITVTDPIGQPLLDVVSIELKCGYNSLDPFSMFDSFLRKPEQNFPKFLHQAHRDSRRAGAPYWWVIHKRDRKHVMIYFPDSFSDVMDECKQRDCVEFRHGKWHFQGMRFEDFLWLCSPEDIKREREEFLA